MAQLSFYANMPEYLLMPHAFIIPGIFLGLICIKDDMLGGVVSIFGSLVLWAHTTLYLKDFGAYAYQRLPQPIMALLTTQVMFTALGVLLILYGWSRDRFLSREIKL